MWRVEDLSFASVVLFWARYTIFIWTFLQTRLVSILRMNECINFSTDLEPNLQIIRKHSISSCSYSQKIVKERCCGRRGFWPTNIGNLIAKFSWLAKRVTVQFYCILPSMSTVIPLHMSLAWSTTVVYTQRLCLMIHSRWDTTSGRRIKNMRYG